MNTAENQDLSGERSAPPPPPHHYQQGAFQVPPPRRRLSGLTIFLIILCGFLLLMVIGMAASKSAGFALGGDLSGKLQEKIVVSGKGKQPDKIAVITLRGVIKGTGSYVSGEETVQQLSKQLRRAAEDDRVKAVLLQVDTPGGGLTASDIIRNEIMRVQEAGKKVVVCVGGLAASGGLYISAPADYIFAHPTALVGSIGVIMTRFQVKELIKKLGIRYDPIKSADMKDIGSPFRDLSQEERKYFEGLIRDFNERFISIVSEGRKLDLETVRKLANGKIYTADQGLEYKLIDRIGYFDDALEKTKELAGVEDPHIIKYAKRFEDFGILSSLLEGRSTFGLDEAHSLLQSMIDMDVTPKVMAIWDGRVE